MRFNKLFEEANLRPIDGSELEHIYVDERELPDIVRDEIKRIKDQPRYMSADSDGVLRIKKYEKIELEDGEVDYIVLGDLSKHVSERNIASRHGGNQPFEIVVKTKDGKIMEEAKLEEKGEYVIAR